MSKALGIGIIGYGGMGGWHADLIQDIPEATLIGTYDILKERQQASRDKGFHAFESREEMLANPDIEVITIATPNDTHLEIAEAAMNAGKHVVSEKPVAMNSDELEEMLAIADKNGVLFTVHQNRRWDEDYLTVKKIYDDNTLGRVFNIESRVHGSRGIPGDWRAQKKHGGGMVLDWGVHLFDQMLQMFHDRKLESLYAQLHNVTNEEVDDGFRAILNFEDDLTALVEVGTSNFINMPRWYMQGVNGSAIIENWERDGEIVMVSDWEARDAVPVRTAAGLTKTMAPRTEETIERYPLPELKADIRDFYKNVKAAVRNGEKLFVQPDEVMDGMKLMEAVFESAEKNQVITF